MTKRSMITGICLLAFGLQGLADEVPVQTLAPSEMNSNPALPSLEQSKARKVAFDLSAGLSYWEGDTTYSVGGKATSGGETVYVDDPVSELKFPLGVSAASVDGAITFGQRLELYGGMEMAVSDPGGEVEDSDWKEGVKVEYAEWDCELSGWSGDGGLRWWFTSKTCEKSGITFGLAPTVGYTKQSVDWDVKNPGVWSSSDPNEAQGEVGENVSTYDYDMDMLYAGAKASVQHRRFALSAFAGASAWLNMQSTYKHIFRSKLSTTDYDGNAWFAEGEGRFYFTPSVFLLGRIHYLYAKADGTEQQSISGGEYAGWAGEIDGDIVSKQFTGTLGVGYSF